MNGEATCEMTRMLKARLILTDYQWIHWEAPSHAVQVNTKVCNESSGSCKKTFRILGANMDRKTRYLPYQCNEMFELLYRDVYVCC